TFTHVPHHPSYVGRDFADVAEERGQSVEDMMCDLLLEEKLDVGYFSNPEGTEEQKAAMDRDFVYLLSRPYYMIGSDAIPYGPRPHPRAFGAFPRFFRLAREQGMAIETFAYHASALPARTFKLKDRGEIRVGGYGDLVVLDRERVTDTSTYKHPRRGPKGIEYVLVNGQISLWQGQVTGILAGQGLRRGR
ncbi:MAG: amidohydrolase family protein, partial [Christensenellaceae bacterium]